MTDIASHYAAADKARAANQPAAMVRHLEAVLALDPRQPRALNSLGLYSLGSGDPVRAAALLARATAADPQAIELWLNLANAQRTAGDNAAERASLERVLAIDPYQVIALLQKAQNQERQDDRSGAARNYAAILSIIGTATPPPALAAALVHGRSVIAAEQRALGEAVAPYIAAARGATGGPGPRRFEHCVDILLGRQRLLRSTPTGLHYPGLPEIEFFDRDAFDWLPRLEAATPVIQREFAGLLDGVVGGFAPYVDVPAGAPVNQWANLNRSLDWSALFLWKDGVRNDDNCARCPQTAALLEGLPLLDMPGRGPAAFFSVLRPGAHIPPHVGVTNIRSVIHLPLVVPPDCAIRVGSQTREWQVGSALAFDDTIEHEAWNRSGEPRAVLIVDAWNPGLDADERVLLRALTRGMDAHAAGPR